MNALELVGLTLVSAAAVTASAAGTVAVRRRRLKRRTVAEASGLLGDLADDSAKAQGEFEQVLAGLRSDDGPGLSVWLPRLAQTGRRHEQRLGSAHLRLERLAAAERHLAATAGEVARQRDRVGTLCRTAENSNPADPKLAVAAVTIAVSDVVENERSLRAEMTDAKARLEGRASRLADAERGLHTDPLTRLPNRRAFVRKLQQTIESSPPSSFTVAAFAIDGLPEFVAGAGHTAGDAVVAVAARVVRESVRPCDFVARIGPGEFAVLMPAADANTASFIAKTVRRASKTAEVRLPERTASFSLLGGSTPPTQGLSAEDLLAEARDARTRAHASDPDRLLTGGPAPTARGYEAVAAAG